HICEIHSKGRFGGCRCRRHTVGDPSPAPHDLCTSARSPVCSRWICRTPLDGRLSLPISPRRRIRRPRSKRLRVRFQRVRVGRSVRPAGWRIMAIWSPQQLSSPIRARSERHVTKRALVELGLVALIVVSGTALRLADLDANPFWVDEAESSINALTILTHGYPTDRYLGLP